MELIILKCNVGENKIEFSRNYKGIWSCSFSMNCDDLFDGFQVSQGLMVIAEEMLKEFNNHDRSED